MNNTNQPRFQFVHNHSASPFDTQPLFVKERGIAKLNIDRNGANPNMVSITSTSTALLDNNHHRLPTTEHDTKFALILLIIIIVFAVYLLLLFGVTHLYLYFKRQRHLHRQHVWSTYQAPMTLHDVPLPPRYSQVNLTNLHNPPPSYSAERSVGGCNNFGAKFEQDAPPPYRSPVLNIRADNVQIITNNALDICQRDDKDNVITAPCSSVTIPSESQRS